MEMQSEGSAAVSVGMRQEHRDLQSWILTQVPAPGVSLRRAECPNWLCFTLFLDASGIQSPGQTHGRV